VIPERWEGFRAVRQFRGVTYNIIVRRQGPGNAVALTLDGWPVEGNVLPLPGDGRAEATVEAVLG